MRETTKGRRAFLICILPIFMTMIFGGCKSRPIGKALLIEKGGKLRPGMTIAEVNAVMFGHPRKEHDSGHPQGIRTRLGPMSRPSVRMISYDDRPGADEGDYALDAYFDSGGLLVGWGVSEYLN